MEKEVIRDLQLAYNECAMLEGCINRLFITDSRKESKSFQNILTDFLEFFTVFSHYFFRISRSFDFIDFRHCFFITFSRWDIIFCQ